MNDNTLAAHLKRIAANRENDALNHRRNREPDHAWDAKKDADALRAAAAALAEREAVGLDADEWTTSQQKHTNYIEDVAEMLEKGTLSVNGHPARHMVAALRESLAARRSTPGRRGEHG